MNKLSRRQFGLGLLSLPSLQGISEGSIKKPKLDIGLDKVSLPATTVNPIEVFEMVMVEDGQIPDFPLDIIYPDGPRIATALAYTRQKLSKYTLLKIERHIGGNYIIIPMFMRGNLKRNAWELLSRAANIKESKEISYLDSNIIRVINKKEVIEVDIVHARPVIPFEDPSTNENYKYGMAILDTSAVRRIKYPDDTINISSRESYFPLKILLVDSNQIKIVNSPEEIPSGKTIRVLKIRYLGK